MLEIENLTMRFGCHIAVNNLSFRVERPQMIGVVGASGAGKSSLLRLIARGLEPTAGRLTVDGTDLLRLRGRARWAWNRDCAMIFQQFNLIPRLDVLTNVILGRLHDQSLLRSCLRLFTRTERHTALRHLDRFGLAPLALKRVEHLSGGEAQRVAICRALMQRPRFILADEPIASLDRVNAELVMRTLRDVHLEDGLTVICNLHSIRAARRYCDRILGLSRGVLVFDGPVAALSDRELQAIYAQDDPIPHPAHPPMETEDANPNGFSAVPARLAAGCRPEL